MPLDDLHDLLDDDEYANDKPNASIVLTRLQRTAIHLMIESQLGRTMVTADGKEELSYELSDVENMVISRFLEISAGDLELNALVRQEAKNGGKLEGFFLKLGKSENAAAVKEVDRKSKIRDVFKELTEFTFRTRHDANFLLVADKAKILETQRAAGSGIDTDKKLALREFAVMHDLHALAAMKNNAFVGKFFSRKLCHCIDTISPIYNRLESAYEDLVMDRPMIAFRSAKKEDIMQGELTIGINLRYLGRRFMDYIHVGRLTHHNQRAYPLQSELTWEGYKERPYKFAEHLYNDHYAILIDKLISDAMQKKLQEKYGDVWLKEVNYRFHRIEQAVYVGQQTRYAGIKAGGGMQILLTYPLPRWLANTQFFGNRWKDVMQKSEYELFYESEDCEMCCSEWLALTIIETIERLNDELLEVLKLEPAQDRVVENPFSEYEALHYMAPDRLLEILEAADCVEKYEPLHAFEEIVRPKI